MIPDFTQYLIYNSSEGKLYWKNVNKYHKEKNGDECGWVTAEGYRRFKLGNKSYATHKVIYYLETGKWYGVEIDHIDNNKLNNHIDNLREVTRRENVKNTPVRSTNKLGEKYIRRLGSKYQVRCDGKSYGCYNTLEEAKQVRYEVAIKLNFEYWMIQEKGKPFELYKK